MPMIVLTKVGILRHVISIACGVAFYYIHEYVFVDILDVEVWLRFN